MNILSEKRTSLDQKKFEDIFSPQNDVSQVEPLFPGVHILAICRFYIKWGLGVRKLFSRERQKFSRGGGGKKKPFAKKKAKKKKFF